MTEIRLENIYIKYTTTDKEIFMQDLTDQNNDPALYTKGKRNLAKAWAEIVEATQKNPSIRFSAIWDIISKWNIKSHYWCMVD